MPRTQKARLPEPAQPRLNQHLPRLVTDVLQAGRDAGKPYHYTTRDVRAIVRYVSDKKDIPKNAFTPIDWSAVDRKFDANKRAIDRFRQEHEAEQHQRSLEARLAGPSLASRIADAEASATYTPIAPKPLPGSLDFTRLAPNDLLEIIGRKLNATRRRLIVFDEVPLPDTTNHEHAAAFDRLRDRLRTLHRGLLVEQHETLTHHQWTQLNWCLKSIGDINFSKVRARHARILAELAAVSNVGHLVWVPLSEEFAPVPVDVV